MSGSKTARAAAGVTGEDTALRYLSREDRNRLSMDAWEPSLLRHMLRALGRDRPVNPEPEQGQSASEPQDLAPPACIER